MWDNTYGSTDENIIVDAEYTIYEMLLKESESRHMTITTLAEDYNYYDGFGYANTRLYTLQELIGDERTGIYNASTMRALQNVYISQGVEADIYEPELTPDNLREVKSWYDNENELMKPGAYQLENGWGDIFKEFFILEIGIAYRDVEVPNTDESNGTYQNTGGSNGTYQNTSNLSPEELAQKVPDIYKENFKCNQFADEMERLMIENDISGERITVQSKTDYIWSDNYGVISENGNHYAIRVEDTIFDNLNP